MQRVYSSKNQKTEQGLPTLSPLFETEERDAYLATMMATVIFWRIIALASNYQPITLGILFSGITPP